MKMKNKITNEIYRNALICVLVGTFLCLFSSIGFSQSSQLFRTYRKDVPTKISESSDAIAAGKKVYEERCYYCHGIKGDGKGPVAPRLDPKPRNFTRNEYKVRSTELGMLPTDEDLFRIITSGVEGTAMPFWSTLRADERWQVIFYIKTFNEDFKGKDSRKVAQLEGEKTSSPESIKRGRGLFKEAKCFLCHGEDGKADGQITTTLKREWGLPFKARNLTKSWLFKGGNTAKDVNRTISTGINETPMGSYAKLLSGEDRWHLSHFVKSLSHDMNTEVVLKSKLMAGNLASSPDDGAWDAIPFIEMPLAGQIVANPRMWTPGVNSIKIKSMYNNNNIAFLMEWDDNTNEQAEVYSDGVALQFPMQIPEGMKKPYFAMGESGKGVTIWHWRAYDEARLQAEKGDEESETATDGGESIVEDEEAGGEEETAEAEGPQEEAVVAEEVKEEFVGFVKVKEMNAKGFKNLSVQPSNSQDSKGKGHWKNGKWSVMIVRPLTTDEKKIDIQFEANRLIPYALAVWDGSNKEIGGQKSISSWYYLTLETTTPKTVYLYVIITIILAAAILLWIVARIRRFPPTVPDVN